MENPVTAWSDRELIDETKRAAGAERRATVELVSLLGEVDARRLYLGEGCASLFTFCTQVLHLSEHAAYHRIEAARAARRFPSLLTALAEGALTLTTVALLRPHLTAENHEQLVAAARHKPKREVERQVACLAPRPDLTPTVRKLPTVTAAAARAAAIAAIAERPAAPALLPCLASERSDVQDAPADKDGRARFASSFSPVPALPPRAPLRPTLSPLAADRYLLKVTIGGETHTKLRRAQDLIGPAHAAADLATMLDRALTLLVEQLERTRLKKIDRPTRTSRVTGPTASHAGSRHVPAALKRAVWARDGGRCAFEGAHGRCTETSRLELHHLIPFAAGGPTTEENLALRCRAHNRHESEQRFGPWTIDKRTSASPITRPT